MKTQLENETEYDTAEEIIFDELTEAILESEAEYNAEEEKFNEMKY